MLDEVMVDVVVGSDCSVLVIYGEAVDALLGRMDDVEYPTDELSPVKIRKNVRKKRWTMNVVILLHYI